MKRLTVISFLIALCMPCAAQEYNYVHYNTKDGLAGSVVFDMVQDHDGFIWFATETGLSRFDGTRFKNFTVSDGLPDNEIIKLFIDSRNRMWLLPFSNAVCYYHDGTIYNKHNDSLIGRLHLNGYIRSMKENALGDLALVQDTKITIIKADGAIKEYDNVHNMPSEIATPAGVRNKNDFIFSMSQRGKQNIYIYSKDSFHLISSINLQPDRYYPIYFGPSMQADLSADREIIVKSDSGSLHLPQPGFLKMEQLNDSLVVVCWATRVETYNLYRKKLERVIYVGQNVNNFLEDREGNWWFSTLGSGVYRLPTSEIKNYVLRRGKDVLPAISMEKYEDTLFVGTDHFEVWTFGLKTNTVSQRVVGAGPTPGKIVTLNRMRNGSLYAGTEYGLIRVRPSLHFPDFRSAVKSTHAYDDTLLFGTNWSAFVYNTQRNHISDTLLRGRNTAVYQQGGNYYLGTLRGLYMRDREQKMHYLGSLHPSLSGKISVVRATKNGIVWVGTYGFGIIGLQNQQVVAVVNADSGLTSNICRTLYANENILWIGTDKGLNKVEFDGKKFSIKKYTAADGLSSDMINAIAHDGTTVYVGTPAGVSYFNEEKVITHSMCRLKITGIETPERKWKKNTSGLQFRHYENDIRIEFSGISFKSGGEILYRYRMKGLDNTWRETRDNFLSFLSLPSGDYDLELQAVNKFGVKSEAVHLRFSVAKLLWEKTWFRVSVVLLLALLFWMLIRYRIKKIRQEAIRKIETTRKITELEQMALKAQMNPHFIFNSLHSIQQYVIDKDVAGANKYISDFARLIRLTLDISSQTKISLADEINYISTYLELEKAKFEGRFDYSVNAAGLDEHSLFIPAMLLQPYIENSIRHGIYYRTDNKGMIRVDFSLVGDYLVCTLEDNGVGRKAAEQFKSGRSVTHHSKGMSITAKRIDMLNQQYLTPIFAHIEDVYEEGINKISGTRVVLRFPIQEVKKQV